MNLSFNLGLGGLRNPFSGFPTILSKLTSSLLITGTTTAQIEATDATSYGIIGLPAWGAINPTTGVITITGDGTVYGQEIFTTTATNDRGTTTKADGIKITLARPQDGIGNNLGERETVLSDEAMTLNSTSSSSPGHMWNGNGWDFFVPFYTSYGQNNQWFIVGQDGTLKDTASEWDAGTIITTPSGHMIVSELGYSFRSFDDQVVKYNHGTGLLESFFTVPNAGGNYHPIRLGTNRKLVLGNSQSTTPAGIVVMEIDETTGAHTSYTVGQGQGCFEVASDATHVYATSTVDNGHTKLFSIRKSDNLVTTLIDSTQTNHLGIRQTRYGVWLSVTQDTLGHADGDYYVYDGVLSLATDIYDANSASIPWTNYGDSLVAYYWGNVDLATYPTFEFEVGETIPLNGEGYGVLWFRLDGSSDTWLSANLPNVLTYPIDLNYVIGANDKIVAVGNDYTGYTVKDVNTLATNSYKLKTITLSPYCFLADGIYLYISGYPSGAIFRLDTTKDWDDTYSVGSNPNTPTTPTNPEFLGYSGLTNILGGGQHKNFAMVKLESENTLVFFGEEERSGTGLGASAYNITTGAIEGADWVLGAGASNYIPKEAVITDNYIVFCCNRLSDNGLTIGRMEFATRTFTYLDIPTTTALGSSRIEFVSGDDVLVLTTLNSSTVVTLGVDASLMSVSFSNNVPNLASSLYNLDTNKQVDDKLERLSDGNVYASISGKLILVDDTTGYMETGSSSAVGGYVSEFDGKLYNVNLTDCSSKTDYLIPKTLQLVPLGTLRPVTEFYLDAPTGGSVSVTNKVFSDEAQDIKASADFSITNTGAATGSIKLRFILAADTVPIGSVVTVKFDIVSVSGYDTTFDTISLDSYPRTFSVTATVGAGATPYDYSRLTDLLWTGTEVKLYVDVDALIDATPAAFRLENIEVRYK